MTIEEMREKLDALEINWHDGCPGAWDDTTDCPDEYEGLDANESCPQCWIKYGKLNKEEMP